MLPTLRYSVALATHNGAQYLEQQVLSVLAQRPAPFEIVLSDDASSDGSVTLVRSVVEGYRAANPEIQTELVVIENRPALGVVRNFEGALARCRGELIALCDQDDVWHPGRMARFLREFEEHPDLLLVHSDARLVDGEGNALGHSLLEALEATPAERRKLASGDGFAVLLRRNLMTGATAVLRRSLAEAATPFPPQWVHDEWLALLAASLGSVRLIPEQLIDYRQHESNQIGAVRPTLRFKVRKLREPRHERNVNLVERAAVLEYKLQGFAGRVSQEKLDAVRNKLRHDRFRMTLPAVRALRVGPILLSAARGSYRRYSRGAMDMLRDLVQPSGGTSA